MSFLGRYNGGDAVMLYVVTVDAYGVPAKPDSTPYAKIYDQTGNYLETVYLPVVDRVNYGFGKRLLLGDTYESHIHKCSVVYRWTMSGVTYGKTDTFEVVEYASGRGVILSMRTVSRPGGEWVIMHDESGAVKAGYRPYV